MIKGSVLIIGAGELASAVAYKLKKCGFNIAMLEKLQPLAVRRGVCFAQAVFAREVVVEGIKARKVDNIDQLQKNIENFLPVLPVENTSPTIKRLKPTILIDATLIKKNVLIQKEDALITIGLGPGYNAGQDCDLVVETNRGHNLGRLYYQGRAAADTKTPGAINGYTVERVLRASQGGTFTGLCAIGSLVKKGDLFGKVDDENIYTELAGVVRGALYSGIKVQPDLKVGDIDPRGIKEYCFTISDKARAIAGGVLEGIITLGQQRGII